MPKFNAEMWSNSSCTMFGACTFRSFTVELPRAQCTDFAAPSAYPWGIPRSRTIGPDLRSSQQTNPSNKLNIARCWRYFCNEPYTYVCPSDLTGLILRIVKISAEPTACLIAESGFSNSKMTICLKLALFPSKLWCTFYATKPYGRYNSARGNCWLRVC